MERQELLGFVQQIREHTWRERMNQKRVELQNVVLLPTTSDQERRDAFERMLRLEKILRQD